MFKPNRFHNILFHFCGWLMLILTFWLWRPLQQPTWRPQLSPWLMIVSGLPFVGLFYLNAYWLIPEYFSRKKKWQYFLLAAAALLITLLAVSAIAIAGSPPAPPGFHYINFRRSLPGIFFLMAGASLGISRENTKLGKRQKEKETEHLRTELSFLRTQVNPHFMLNVLNSMVLLARKKSDLLEPVLMELARLMNYMLYDANNEKIVLEDEIGYLQAYIDLQMLRFGSDVTVRFNTPASANGSFIEPMLLIPMVENAFKHGIGLVKDPIILIDIAEKDERLTMTVKNKYSPLIRQQEGKPSGIGLNNLKKRLELIYPGEFELQRTDSLRVDHVEMENWFIITLNIPLQ
jgi:two-component system LytT family sensor kinase